MTPTAPSSPHLKYPPFILDRTNYKTPERHGWGDLRIDGYIGGKLVISKSLSGAGLDRKFALLPDDTHPRRRRRRHHPRRPPGH